MRMRFVRYGDEKRWPSFSTERRIFFLYYWDWVFLIKSMPWPHTGLPGEKDSLTNNFEIVTTINTLWMILSPFTPHRNGRGKSGDDEKLFPFSVPLFQFWMERIKMGLIRLGKKGLLFCGSKRRAFQCTTGFSKNLSSGLKRPSIPSKVATVSASIKVLPKPRSIDAGINPEKNPYLSKKDKFLTYIFDLIFFSYNRASSSP